MEIRYVPFANATIIYRPLLPLAFLGNVALARYIAGRRAGQLPARGDEVDAFLDQINFWRPDPPEPVATQPTMDQQPATVVLLMTNQCNLRCTYCYARAGESAPRTMALPLAQRAIDLAHRNAQTRGLERFALTFHGGGEPTANWDVLVGAVKHAESKDLPCEITMSTNGVLSDGQRAFIVEHFSGISLSMDGLPTVQNIQRPTLGGGDSFGSVRRTLMALDSAGLRYGVRLTLTPATFSTLPAAVEWLCHETACQGIHVEPNYTGARGAEHGEPEKKDAELFIAAFREAFALAARYGRALFYSGARLHHRSAMFCRAATDALVVTPEGDLVGCFEVHDRTHPLHGEFHLGTLRDESPFQENESQPNSIHFATAARGKSDPSLPILGNPRNIEIHSHSEVGFDNPIWHQPALDAFTTREETWRAGCEECFCYWHCAGDCATRRVLLADRSGGRCHANREITKEILAWYIAAFGGVWDGAIPFEAPRDLLAAIT